MRIAMVTPRYPPNIKGGGEISCSLLVEELRKKHEVAVFHMQMLIPDVRTKWFLNKKTVEYFTHHIPLDDYDIVHAYNMDLLLAVGMLTKKQNINSYATLNGIVFSPSQSIYDYQMISPRYYRNLFYMYYILQIKMFSTLNEWSRQKWIHDGINKNRISVVTNMIDPKFRVQKRTKHRGIHVLHLANFTRTEEKEIEYVIEIWSKINKIEDLSLTMIGSGTSRKEALVRKFKPENPVHVIGSVNHDEISKYYADADILLHPSINPTGCDRVIIEAMQHGCVVLTHCNDQLSPIIRDHVDGFFVYPYSLQVFSEMLKALIIDEDVRSFVSKNAVKRINEICSPRKIASEYVDRYQVLL